MIKRKLIWQYAILICLISALLIGSVSAVSPEMGVKDKNLDDKEYVHHPAKAVMKSEKGISVMAAAAPVHNDRSLLVLLVETSDLAPLASHDAAYFENLFFGTRPSVADYYTEVSYGDFTYTQATVLDPGNDNIAPFWYQPSYTTAEIANDVLKQKEMVRWAIQQAANDINFAIYDTNNDGTVTNEELTLYIVVTGTGKEMSGGTAAWAYHRWAGSVTADGKTIEGEYSITSENSPVGTFAHELGHDLGLPDLYDIDDTNGDSEGIGHFGLMGSGSWCGPAHMTAWEKAELGWLTPTVVPANGFYNIKDSETNSEAYILRSASHRADEYFLVENRWRGTSYDSIVGREGSLPDEGIIIYHIDDAQTGNADETHKKVDVECSDSPTSHVADADDLDSLANRGDANDLWDCNEYDFTDTSTPAKSIWYGGGTSGISVSQFPCVGATMRTYLAITPNDPPKAEAKGPYNAPEGTAIELDASGSSDANGDALQYRWDINTDGTWEIPWTSDAKVSYTWCDDFTGTVTLEVTDGQETTSDTAAVTVTNVAPKVDAGVDQNVDEGDMVQFGGTASDAGTCDTLTYSWDFGDGSAAVTGTLTPTHSYCDNKIYTVTLTVTDGNGESTSDTLAVTVDNKAPTADAGPDQTTTEGAIIAFSGSSKDAGTCDTLTYSWDFGDSSAAVTNTLTPTHAYGDNGDYMVTLTVTDDEGGVGTDTLTVKVTNVAPTLTRGAMDQPNPQFILPKVHTLTFHGTFSDPGWLDTHTATWNFGDGLPAVTKSLTEENNQPDAMGTVTATHVYSAPGNYQVTVTVTDDDLGATTSAAWTVHVMDVAEAKHDLAAYIQNLPSNAFKGKEVQQKAAFANMFKALDDMIVKKEWNGFITSIQSNIRSKADGQVDGKPQDDWIKDKTAQQHICMKVDDIVAYVKTLK